MKIECSEYQLSVILESVSERIDFLEEMIEDYSTLPSEAKEELEEIRQVFNELNKISKDRYGYVAP